MGVYQKVGLVAVGVGVIMMVVAPMITKYMHLDTLENDAEDVAAEPAE